MRRVGWGSVSLRRSLGVWRVVLEVGIDPTRRVEGRQGTAERGGIRIHFGRSHVDPEIARKKGGHSDMRQREPIASEANIKASWMSLSRLLKLRLIRLSWVVVFQTDGEKVARELHIWATILAFRLSLPCHGPRTVRPRIVGFHGHITTDEWKRTVLGWTRKAHLSGQSTTYLILLNTCLSREYILRGFLPF